MAELNFTAQQVAEAFAKRINEKVINATNRLFNPATLVEGAIFDFRGIEMKDDGTGNWAEHYKCTPVVGVPALRRPSTSPITGFVLAQANDQPVQESIEDVEKIPLPIRSLMGAKHTVIKVLNQPEKTVSPATSAMSVIALFQMFLGKAMKVVKAHIDETDTIRQPDGTFRPRTCYVFVIADTPELLASVKE